MELSPNPFSRAHLEGLARKRQKVNSELPSDKLSASNLTLDNCYITEVLAFPRSLAVLRREVLHWNATCWLDRFPIPRLTMRKIADHCKTPTLHEGQICEFKGSQLNNDRYFEVPDIRLLVVFPHMKKSFDNEEVQRFWTNNIVLPSIYRHVDSSARQHLPTSYRLLRLDSEAKKVELGFSSGDTPLCVSFRSDNLEGIWADIVSKTREKEFEEFSGAFLVALGQWHPTATINKSVEGAWKTLIDSYWGLEMDMNYIPTETFQVRMENEFRLERRVKSEAASVVGERHAPLIDDDAGADSGDDSESVSSSEE